MCQVYQRPLTIIVDAYVKKNPHTPALNICTLAEFLWVSPNIMAKANGFFHSFFGGLFLLLSVVSLCLAPLPCPLHPCVHFGTSAGVGCVGLTSAGSLVAGGSWTESMSSQRKRDRMHSKCGEKGQHWPTSWCPFITKESFLLNATLFFFGLSKHFTGSVFNTKPVIKGVQTAWGRKVEKENRGSFGCFPDTWVWPSTFVLGLHLVQTSVWEQLKQLDQDSTQLFKHLHDIVKLQRELKKLRYIFQDCFLQP